MPKTKELKSEKNKDYVGFLGLISRVGNRTQIRLVHQRCQNPRLSTPTWSQAHCSLKSDAVVRDHTVNEHIGHAIDRGH